MGADLSGSGFLQSSLGAAYYSPSTRFDDTNFDPAAHGWVLVADQAWGDLCSIPEPGTGALLAFGLAALAQHRRSRGWPGSSAGSSSRLRSAGSRV